MEFDLLLPLLLLAGLAWLMLRNCHRRRLAYIATYRFHPAIKRKVQERYPHLSEAQVERVFDALRLSVNIPIGTRIPCHCTAMGRILLTGPEAVMDSAESQARFREALLLTAVRISAELGG